MHATFDHVTYVCNYEFFLCDIGVPNVMFLV